MPSPIAPSLRAALASWGARGETLTAAQLRAVLTNRAELAWWETRLHLCQLYSRASVPSGASRPMATFLRRCLADEHPFVRAWAFSAMARYLTDRGRLTDAHALLREGADDPAASVRARVRAAQRELERRATSRR